MSRKQWKIRFSDMQDAAQKIIEFSRSLKSEAEFTIDVKTLDACLRNFQVLGDAAKTVPPSIKRDYPQLPWTKIQGMRNILVHEYFGVSSKILWKTIQKDIPPLLEELKKANSRLSSPAHPWKICPPGETYVRQSSVDWHLRQGRPVREHLRRDHCRECEASTKNILTKSEVEDMARLYFEETKGAIEGNNLGFGKLGTAYDPFVRGWVKYWNEVLKPDSPLDFNLVKALIASESSFQEQAGKGSRTGAKGLMQLMPSTVRYLSGERNELKDHIFEIDSTSALDPNMNIAAGTRWLFRKRETASARLGRTASWEEAVAEYKDYLRRNLKNPSARQKGMETFQKYLRDLKGQK